jgi:hypothetical protein
MHALPVVSAANALRSTASVERSVAAIVGIAIIRPSAGGVLG